MGLVKYERIAFPLTDLMKKILVIAKKQGGTTPMSKIVSEIQKNSDIAQSTISRNIQNLAIVGLLKINGINGREKECSLTQDGKEVIGSNTKIMVYS